MRTLSGLRAGCWPASLALASIAGGVLPLVAVHVVNQSLSAGVHDTVERLSGGAPLAVWMGFGELVFPEAMGRVVAPNRAVFAILPLVRGTVALADDPTETFQLVGVDLGLEAGLRPTWSRLPGDGGDLATSLGGPQSLALTATLARRYGVDVGGSIRLATPRGIADFTVRRLLEPEGLAGAFGGRLAVMDLPAAQDVLAKTGRVDQIDLLLKPGADAAAVRNKLQTRLPHTLTVALPSERAGLYESVLAPFQTMLTRFGLLWLAAAVYPAYAALSSAAIRLRPGEVLLLGAIGTGVGMAGGMALAGWCVGRVSDAIATVLELRFPFGRLAVDPGSLMGIAVLGIVVTLLASVLARRAVATVEARRVTPPGSARPPWRQFPMRAAMAIAAGTLVMTVAVALAAVLASRRESLSRYYDQGGFLAGDLVVGAATTEGGLLETPLPEALGADIRAIPGVRAVETVRALPGQRYRGRRITVLGLSDGLTDPSRYGTRWYVDGDPSRAAAALRAHVGADVSAGLAERFDLHLGDSLELDNPTGTYRAPVVGIVRDYLSEQGTVVMRRNAVATLWDEINVSRFTVFVADGVSVEAVRLAIAERLGNRYALNVSTPREVIDRQSRLLGRAFDFTGAFQLLIAVVMFAGIFDLLAAAGTDRRRAVLHSAALGGLVAVLGTTGGLAAALVLARRLHLEYHPALGATTWYVTLAIGMALLAGYRVARQAKGGSG